LSNEFRFSPEPCLPIPCDNGVAIHCNPIESALPNPIESSLFPTVLAKDGKALNQASASAQSEYIFGVKAGWVFIFFIVLAVILCPLFIYLYIVRSRGKDKVKHISDSNASGGNGDIEIIPYDGEMIEVAAHEGAAESKKRGQGYFVI
jgi:hypothetical protein